MSSRGEITEANGASPPRLDRELPAVPPFAAADAALASLQRFVDVVALWLARVGERRRLAELSPRELADIGLEPASRAYECAKWCWQR